jgi:hypothetical protein
MNFLLPLSLRYVDFALHCYGKAKMKCQGLGTEFRSEKIHRNRLGTVSVVPRKKMLIPRHSKLHGKANSVLGTKFRRKTAKNN